MKVLIVHSQMAMFGGAEVLIVRLATHLQEQGHIVTIATLSTKNIDAYKDLEIVTPKHQIEYRLRGSLSTLSDVYKMWRELSNLCTELAPGYDVINAHNFPAIWCVPTSKKVVWMCNEVPDLFHNHHISSLINPLLNSGRWVDRTIVRGKHPTAIVADENMARIFSHRYLLTPKIIPYGIDGEFFAHASRISHNDFTIIQPSMVSPSKNQFAVLEAVDVLRKNIPNIKAVFAGYMEPDNAYTKLLKEYIKEHNIEKNVIFTGLVAREYLRELYSVSDVAVFSGVGQGSWLGPFEAIAAGIPAIVSPKLSCSSLVAREKLGLVTDNITEEIIKVFNNKPETQRQKEYVLQNLTWNKFCGEFTKLL